MRMEIAIEMFRGNHNELWTTKMKEKANIFWATQSALDYKDDTQS